MEKKINKCPNKASVEDFSLLDPLVQSSPYEFYEVLHEQCPVYRMPETGFYVVTKYDDLREVLRNTKVYSSDSRVRKVLQGDRYVLQQEILKERGWEHIDTLQQADPPVHTRHRKLIDRVFTAKRVREMAGHVDDIVHSLIDSWIDDGECEFVSQFALPLPAIIIAEQLGLSRDEIGTFKRWADAIAATGKRVLNEEEMREVVEVQLEAQHYLFNVFEDRRAKPQNDIISALVHAHKEGEDPLSMHELQNIMHQLVSGGFETTTSALAGALWLLIRHPDQMALLRENRDLLPNFVEESLRYESPVQGLARQTTTDIELNGTLIPKDSVVIVRYAAANRDEEKFPDSGKFDITRENAKRQLAFGLGAHFCLGASLARQEMISAFDALLDRLDNIQLARELPTPVHPPSFLLHPFTELPIKFDAKK